ncbi:urea carboxylase-associated family protein [Variovorax sp. CY25R-8]|uniref:urea carboxylase-associated family protein n=1 Tax=Variovorax sp. CY25R-8 TaxID=2855501 RepID=UPI0021BB30C7|nr:urea carboxylase-associated family protein [Variovorax sp. CY25R-8]MCT8179251.1 urea carboxylase-associated family protein [Variovorax sp. CY25R-8]
MTEEKSLTHTAGCCRIPPQSGVAFTLRGGQILRINDPFGEQVADLYAFARDDHGCSLSSGRSIDYASKIYLTKGDLLYANNSRPMFRIVDDTVGRHDFLLTPCSQEMFEILYQHQGHHPSCFENLYRALEPYGIRPDQIGTTFNVFMNVGVTATGEVQVKPPISRAGDFIELRAEMDLICGLTACSAENSNNGSFKPIDYEIR